ncbi:zinc finger protein OZF-like [Sitodiplosis mosellana]|uniref:zinc finger protein OZF-like n=1 Tax=Sitodiplosis mosellana TaxID=263140 RepID=UPI002444FEF5|nr:zinc finger protein OZF-like [Sitodiplosis mosellana]
MLPDTLDFDRICRICLSSSENLTDLFSSGEDLIHLLASMTTLSFTANDDLPQHICPFCSHQIQTTRYFILKCQESDRKLRLSLQNSSIEIDEDKFRNDTQKVSNNSNSDNAEGQTKLQSKNDNSRSKRDSNGTKKHTKESDKTTARSYKCIHCPHEYSCNETLLEHMKSHNQDDVPLAENSMVPENSSKLQHLCLICNKTFAKLMNLERHKKIHENCKRKQMKHANHFKVHMRSHRNSSIKPSHSTDETTGNKKQFLCSICGVNCTSRSNLAVHTRRHTGIMTNFCSICGKGYPRSTDLTIHMRKHTGEKPFCCKICNRAFARSDKLTIHVRTHTGEKPYECKNCKRGFSQRNDLISHQRRNVCGSESTTDNKTFIQ